MLDIPTLTYVNKISSSSKNFYLDLWLVSRSSLKIYCGWVIFINNKISI